jgi:hypothetical protein
MIKPRLRCLLNLASLGCLACGDAGMAAGEP